MLILLITTLTRAALAIILVILTTALSEKSIKEREKITPFECGFSPYKKARRPFSLRFFITTLIFLIFDIEIALVLPIGILVKISNHNFWLITSILIVAILLIGLLHEWKNGALNWIK